MNRSKIIIPFYVLGVLLLASCTKKVPIVYGVDHYHQSPNGSFIKAKIKGRQEKINVSGELIAADDKKIIVYTLDNPRILQPYALRDILSYEIYYAKGVENYNIETGLINASTLTHGWFLVLTLPINLIVNGSINESVNKELRFNSKELSADQLFKYARYPNGLPRGIDLSNLNKLLEN